MINILVYSPSPSLIGIWQLHFPHRTGNWSLQLLYHHDVVQSHCHHVFGGLGLFNAFLLCSLPWVVSALILSNLLSLLSHIYVQMNWADVYPWSRHHAAVLHSHLLSSHSLPHTGSVSKRILHPSASKGAALLS